MTAAQKKFLQRTKRAKDAKNPKRPATKRPATKRARLNPEQMAEAEAMYTAFHGREANRIIEHVEATEYRSELAELGKLLELRFRLPGVHAPIPLLEFGNAQVTCTPDGTNIYFVGGAQAVDLESLAITSDKDYVELGELTYIRYFTRKGFHHFEPIEYRHTFGEVDGIRPTLAYDRINRKIFLIGGNYECRPEGIVN